MYETKHVGMHSVAPPGVSRMNAGEVGSQVEFDRVLAVVQDSSELVLGSDLGQARVKGTIEGHDRGDKVLVFKFKRKKQYKRTIGHRQNYTQVRVNEILV